MDEVSKWILDELHQIIECRQASLQLVQGDIRTLLDGWGFDVRTADPWFYREISRDRLISRVVNGKVPLILSDTAQDPDWGHYQGTANVKSWVGIPLVYEQEVVGLLTLDHDQPGFYTSANMDLLVSFAHQAAIDLRKAYLFDNAQERIRHLEIINQVAEIITTKLETHDLLTTIASQIAERLRCTHCTIFFLEEENGEMVLVPKVVQGEDAEEIKKRRFKPGEGVAGWVFQKGQSLVLEDTRKDNRFVPARRSQQAPRSMLVVPIKTGNRTIGVISADQDEAAWFSENDRRLVEGLALQAGIAIERNIGLELLQDIGNRIASLQEVDSILQEIVQGAIKLTGTTTGVIYLISEDGQSVLKGFHLPDFDHPWPRLHLKDGLTRRVIETGQVLLIPDTQKDPRVNSVLLRKNVRSMIAVPLKLKQKVIGVLYLDDERLHDFTETQVSLLSTLASQAAIAIQRARLNESNFLTELEQFPHDEPIRNHEDLRRRLTGQLDMIRQFCQTQYLVLFASIKEDETVLPAIAWRGVPPEVEAHLPHFNWRKAGLQPQQGSREEILKYEAELIVRWGPEESWRQKMLAGIRGDEKKFLTNATYLVPLRLADNYRSVLLFGPFLGEINAINNAEFLNSINLTISTSALSWLQRPLPRRVFPHRRNWRADLTPVLSSPLAEAKNKTDTSPDDDRLPRSVSRCNVVPASG